MFCLQLTYIDFNYKKRNHYMTGKELKTLISDCGVSQSEIARRLGMSQQSFNQCMIVKDVKSGLLEKVAAVLGVDMSFFYPIKGNNVVASGVNSMAAIQSTVSQGDSAVLQERVRLLEKLLDEKERTIKILMER